MRTTTKYSPVTNAKLKALYPTDHWASRYYQAIRIERNHKSGTGSR